MFLVEFPVFCMAFPCRFNLRLGSSRPIQWCSPTNGSLPVGASMQTLDNQERLSLASLVTLL